MMPGMKMRRENNEANSSRISARGRRPFIRQSGFIRPTDDA